MNEPSPHLSQQALTPPSSESTEVPDHLNLLSKPRTQRTTVLLSVICVGSIAGALSAGSCCHKLQSASPIEEWMIAGALVGALGGVLFVTIESRVKSALERSDRASILGAAYGLVPGILLIICRFTRHHGPVGVRAITAAFFVGPAIGFLIGAAFDRGFEAVRSRSWGGIVGIGFGLLFCGLLGAQLVETRVFAEPAEVAEVAGRAIQEKWRKDNIRGTIHQVDLAYLGGGKYEGIAIATLPGNVQQRFRLAVIYDVELVEVEWMAIP